MGGVNFLNLEYFLLLVYRIFTGTNVDISQIPAQTFALMEYIGWTGAILAALFAVLLFFTRRALHATEHAGMHARHEAAEKLRTSRDEAAPVKNPQWERIIQLINSPHESDWRRAIVEADIMLDTMLAEKGYRGETLGDKLKDANPLQFTTLDLAWRAHKVRNDIAHTGGFVLGERDARATVDLFRRVFEEFDYI